MPQPPERPTPRAIGELIGELRALDVDVTVGVDMTAGIARDARAIADQLRIRGDLRELELPALAEAAHTAAVEQRVVVRGEAVMADVVRELAAETPGHSQAVIALARRRVNGSNDASSSIMWPARARSASSRSGCRSCSPSCSGVRLSSTPRPLACGPVHQSPPGSGWSLQLVASRLDRPSHRP